METRRKGGSTPAHGGQRHYGLALEAGMRLGMGRTSACLGDSKDGKMRSTWVTARMGQDARGTDGRRGSDWLDDDEYEGNRMNG